MAGRSRPSKLVGSGHNEAFFGMALDEITKNVVCVGWYHEGTSVFAGGSTGFGDALAGSFKRSGNSITTNACLRLGDQGFNNKESLAQVIVHNGVPTPAAGRTTCRVRT